MKRFSLILLVALSAACSNDDDKKYDFSGTIYGKWYQKETVVNGTTFPYDDHETCGRDYWEFYDGDKVRSIDVWDCEEEMDWIGTFERNANRLSIYDGFDTREVEITKLTSNSFTFEFDADENEDGTSEHYTVRFTR